MLLLDAERLGDPEATLRSIRSEEHGRDVAVIVACANRPADVQRDLAEL